MNDRTPSDKPEKVSFQQPTKTTVLWRENEEMRSGVCVADDTVDSRIVQRSNPRDVYRIRNTELINATKAAAEMLLKIFDEHNIQSIVDADEMSPGFAKRMMETIIRSRTMPLDEMNRWIGFAQCITVKEKMATMNELRNATRSLFSPLYDEWLKDSLDISDTSGRDFVNIWTVNVNGPKNTP
jgi:hypothetical protein